MNRPDAPPKEVGNSPGSIRTVEWLHSDKTILSSCTDTGDIRYVTTLFRVSPTVFLVSSSVLMSSVGYGTYEATRLFKH